MLNLLGSFECRIDPKGRLMLPSYLKKQLEAIIEDGFIIKKNVFSKALELFPKNEWEIVARDLAKLNKYQKETQDFKRKFTAGFRMIEADNVGRILIPKELLVYAEIKKDLVLVADENRIEIWARDNYMEVQEDSTLDYAKIADKLWGINKEGE
mgnify:CR=1 FL=1